MKSRHGWGSPFRAQAATFMSTGKKVKRVNPSWTLTWPFTNSASDEAKRAIRSMAFTNRQPTKAKRDEQECLSYNFIPFIFFVLCICLLAPPEIQWDSSFSDPPKYQVSQNLRGGGTSIMATYIFWWFLVIWGDLKLPFLKRRTSNLFVSYMFHSLLISLPPKTGRLGVGWTKTSETHNVLKPWSPGPLKRTKLIESKSGPSLPNNSNPFVFWSCFRLSR